MKLSLGKVALGLALAGVLIAGPAYVGSAQTDTAALVKQRQDDMRKMAGLLFGQIGRIVRGENPNVAEAAQHAATVEELAKNLSKQFPEKTDRVSVSTSRAKPDVWSKRAEFDQAANAFATEAAKLSVAAKSGNLDAIKAQFGPTAQACGGCHEAKPDDGGKFRAEKQ